MLGVALYWLIVLELFSLVSFPIAYRAFSRLPDRGWTFSKPLGLLFVGFGTWLIGLTHTVPNSRWTVLLALALVGLLAWVAGRGLGPQMRQFVREHRSVIAAAELLFIATFLGVTLLRASISAIAGTEQPMDFMLLNATVTSPHYPPNDPWLAGETVSYYYMGYLMLGAVAMLSGIALPVAYNLGLATAAALGAIAAFGVVFNLIRLGRGSVDGAVFGGIVGAFLLLVASTLVGTLELVRAAGIGGTGFWSAIGIEGFAAPSGPSPSWMPEQTHLWWWRVSRVVPGGINEFPLFSFVLGDLHPHVMSIGFVLLTVGLAVQVYLQPDLLRFRARSRALALAAGVVVIGVAAVAAALAGVDLPRTWVVAAAAAGTVAALGRLWPLGLVVVLGVGALAAINVWDLPLGLALILAAVLLNAARNERVLQFGAAVALSEDTIVVGAPGDPTIGSQAGSAYVYDRQDGRWVRTARLVPTNPHAQMAFGAAVTIDGGLIAVGAPGTGGGGAAYVFERTDDNRWFQRTVLRPPRGQRLSQFGRAIAASAGSIAVGADDVVLVYEGSGGLWALRAKLGAGDIGSGYGESISLDADTLAVGAPDGPGSVFVYRRNGGTWAFGQRLDAATLEVSPGTLAGLGRAVSVRRGHLIAGAKGTAVVFHDDPTGWEAEAVFTAPETVPTETFGAAVAAGRWFAAVGAPGGPTAGADGAPANGHAFVYAHDGMAWPLHAQLAVEDMKSDSAYGGSVAISGEALAVGAPGSGQGAALVYRRDLDRWDLESKLVSRWRMGRAVRAALVVTGVAMAAFVPFYATFQSNTSGILPLRDILTRPLHLLLLWGVPALLVLPVLVLVLRRVFSRANWNLMRFGIAWFVALTPLMFWLQPIYTFPAYAIGLALFGLHQAGYRMPRPDEMLFAYNPRLTLGIGSAVVVVGFAWHGVLNNERGIHNELVAIDRLIIVMPMIVVVALAIYGAWTLAHRDSEVIRTTPHGTTARTTADALAPVLAVLAIASALVLGVELFHVSDVFRGGDFRRLNTMFKLYYQAWLLMAVLGAFGLWYVGSRWNRRVLAGRVGATVWATVLVVALGAVSYYPLAAVTSRAGGGDGLSLDGQAYLLQSAPAEHAAIEWIRDNVARDAVVVEAAAVPCPNEPNGCHSYTDAGRIAGSTGRPTILGWLGHERQWRPVSQHGELQRRFDDVRTIYTTEDPGVARSLLSRYEATYVVVGPRERQMYGTAGAGKFAEIGTMVFPDNATANDLRIYRVGAEAGT